MTLKNRNYLFTLLLLFSTTAWSQILPLQIGNEWQYNVSSNYISCPSGLHSSRVLSMREVQGRQAYEVSNACRGVGSAYLSLSSNGGIDTHYNGRWFRVIDLPLQAGHIWQEFRTRASWKSIGQVSTTAGTFNNCWRKTRLVRYTHWEDYCEGVGLVRLEMKDLRHSYIKMELESYSL